MRMTTVLAVRCSGRVDLSKQQDNFPGDESGGRACHPVVESSTGSRDEERRLTLEEEFLFMRMIAKLVA